MGKLEGLSPSLRTAAEYVVQHPDEVATRSLRQVAIAAEVSPPTLSRLARTLGYDEYEDFREVCRKEIKRRSRVLADRAQDLVGSDTDNETRDSIGPFVGQVRAAIENVQCLLSGIDDMKLVAAAELLARANKVLLIGNASGMALNIYFRYMASMAFDSWRVVGADGSMWGNELSKVGKGDVVFVVSTEPFAAQPVRAAQCAADRGAQVIVINDSVVSPYAGFASICFVTETESPQFFPSHVAPLVLIETLMGMTLRITGEKAVEKIRSTESVGAELGDYWRI